jgi:nitrogen fixation NifU-like protein
MSDELKALYQELILEHAKHPRNYGTLSCPTHQATGDNPVCGDHCEVYLQLEGEVLKDVKFLGTGCAISMASASLMTEAVKGKTVKEAEELFEKFHQLLTDSHVPTMGEGSSEKLLAFAGVREFPIRVKCATLPWHTLRAALSHTPHPVTTE